MASIEKLNKIVDEYYKANVPMKQDYEAIRKRLVRAVDKHGSEAFAIASGLKQTTVDQHYRNVTGTSMISIARLDRAEVILHEWSKA